MIILDNIETAELQTCATRSKLYKLLSDSWQYPVSDFLDLVEDGTFLTGIEALVNGLPYPLDIDREQLGGAGIRKIEREDFEAEFIRIFDTGPGGPPCPLREGLIKSDRQAIMEELIRFYNHFGVSATKGTENNLPDQITTELEFMHYLAFKEVVALQNDQDPGAYMRAERDFLQRHLAEWTSMLAVKMDDFVALGFKSVNKESVLFYKGLLDLTRDFMQSDLGYLDACCKPAG